MKPSNKNSTLAKPKIDKELIKVLKRFIRPHARSIHDTEDILQNVLIKIIKNGENVSAAGFFSWLQKTCHTTTIDFYRKNKSSSYELQTHKIEAQSLKDSDNETLESLSKCVQPILKSLSPNDYQIISAVELDGVSQKELAERNGTNYSALKSKIQRARTKLKNEILECCQVEFDKRKNPIKIKSTKRKNCCA